MLVFRKALYSLCIACMLLTMASYHQAADASQKAKYAYVGSAKSDKFHYPACSAAKRIKSGNLVTFQTRQEALDAGYVACKICKP